MFIYVESLDVPKPLNHTKKLPIITGTCNGAMEVHPSNVTFCLGIDMDSWDNFCSARAL